MSFMFPRFADQDIDEAADWVLTKVDQHADRIAWFETPLGSDSAFLGGLDTAMKRRPGTIGFQHVEIPRDISPDVRSVVAVHEHLFIGGYCVRGCGTIRQVR